MRTQQVYPSRRAIRRTIRPRKRDMKPRVLAVAAFLLLAAPRLRAEAPPEPAWRGWAPDAFDEARRENRFVLLDLGAVWCHWCHVMEETTYRDPKVVDLIRRRFVPVRVDQDARPDLSNRYEDYGWPATLVFAAAGPQLVK